jgi:hypothetical protein
MAAQTAVPTYQMDNNRSGANTTETILTPSNVNVSTFGRGMVYLVEGYVYAQPLYVPNVSINGTSHNVLFVATEHDQLYAFDVSTGRQLWETNFLAGTGPLVTVSTVSSTDVECSDLVPEIGITGTPVIDVATNTMYVVVETKEVNSQLHSTAFYHRLHAVDIRTGKDVIAPHTIAGVVKGTGTGSIGGVINFNPLLANQRASLLLAQGQVFIGWSSHCDLGEYHGWLMSFNQSTLAPTGVFADTPNGAEGGIWGGGSGPAADANGGIYAATGNGIFDVNEGGIDYGDSVMRLQWSSSGLSVVDYFTPWDQASLDESDLDVNSGGLVLLPDQSGKYPHLLFQVGKEGTIDLINRDNMGHWQSGDDDQIVQTLPYVIGGVFGGEAFWNNNAYFSGAHDAVKAFSFNTSTEQLSTTYTSKSSEIFTFPPSTPVVSANGTTNGILWVIEADTYPSTAILRAYSANNLATELYNSNQNPSRDQAPQAVKFTVPTVADGHVFVGGQNQVATYGLLP